MSSEGTEFASAPAAAARSASNPSGTAQTGHVRDVINRALLQGRQPTQQEIDLALNLDINRSLGYSEASIIGPFATLRQVVAGFTSVLGGPLSVMQLGVRGLFGGGTVTANAIDPGEIARESGHELETGISPAGLAGRFAHLAPISGGSGAAPSVPQSTDPFNTSQTPAVGGGGGGGAQGVETPAVSYARPSVLIPLLLIAIGLGVVGYTYWKSKRS